MLITIGIPEYFSCFLNVFNFQIISDTRPTLKMSPEMFTSVYLYFIFVIDMCLNLLPNHLFLGVNERGAARHLYHSYPKQNCLHTVHYTLQNTAYSKEFFVTVFRQGICNIFKRFYENVSGHLLVIIIGPIGNHPD